MAARRCPSCDRPVEPVLNADGIPACPACGAAWTVALPRPQPRLARPVPQPPGGRAAAPSSSSRVTGSGVMASSRPATPGEALALSSGTWVPDPEPGPSPDPLAAAVAERQAAVSQRIERMTPPPPPASADWLRSRVTWAALGAIILGLAVVVVVLLTRTPVAPHPSPAPSDGAATAVATVPPVTDNAPRVVDLMKLIDLNRDAYGGIWSRQPDGLRSDASPWARVAVPYAPPDEYDFKVEFTRPGAGSEAVISIFTVHGHPCCLVLDGWHGAHASGFHMVGGKIGIDAPTVVRDFTMSNDVRHTAVIRVRKRYIEAVYDGQLISHYDTDGSDLSLNAEWDLHGQVMALASYETPVVYHSAQVVEIGARGTFTEQGQ